MRSDVFRKLGPMGPAQLVSPDGASDTGVALSNRFDGTYCNRTNAAIEADQRVRFNARLPWPTETGPSHLQQRQGSIGPMPQSRIEASSEGALSRGHIPRIFLITDKAWSARVDKLNRSLARTHPGWPVLFFDDDMAEAFVKHHYPNMPYAKVFHQFRVSHDTRPSSHPNHTRAALWACGLNQRTATPAPAAEPRMNQCECMMHVAVHPTNYAEK